MNSGWMHERPTRRDDDRRDQDGQQVAAGLHDHAVGPRDRTTVVRVELPDVEVLDVAAPAGADPDGGTASRRAGSAGSRTDRCAAGAAPGCTRSGARDPSPPRTAGTAARAGARGTRSRPASGSRSARPRRGRARGAARSTRRRARGCRASSRARHPTGTGSPSRTTPWSSGTSRARGAGARPGSRRPPRGTPSFRRSGSGRTR